MDYRNASKSIRDDEIFERHMFIDDMCDNEIFNMVVGNENNRGYGGRLINDERTRHQQGVELRDKLRQSLANHNMHRRSKVDLQEYDSYNHVQLVN